MKQNRREFLKKSGGALGMTALATQLEHLGKMAVLAQNQTADSADAPNDYRALVCVFLEGGNDGNNTFVPLHNQSSISNFESYYSIRNPVGLAISQNSFLPISVPRISNLSYGLHPSLGTISGGINNGIHELWAQGKMAIVGNVGTLVAPMTKEQFINYSVKRPLQLFSHPDQVAQYQTGRSDIKLSTGWGGRIADFRTIPDNPNGLAPMITSINGVQLFTSGQQTFPLAIANAQTPLNQVLSPQGYDSSAASQVRLSILREMQDHDLDSSYIAAASRITKQALQVNAQMTSFQEITVPFPNSNFGNQLKQVARIIKKRSDLNVNRQIFYVQLTGFDTHIGQITAQSNLLFNFSQAVRSFYDEMVVQGISDKVTTFTMSDFSRSFDAAGSGVNVGSDHGWGNHSFVIGGAVNGGDLFGINTSNGTPYPTLEIGGIDDVNTGPFARGRWIPTTSVEQYAATLARWYGLPENEMPGVFPNINNFSNTNLGFMQV